MIYKHLFSISETALQIGMGLTKTRELVGNGTIKSVRIGRSIRVPAHAISDFVRDLEDQLQD